MDVLVAAETTLLDPLDEAAAVGAVEAVLLAGAVTEPLAAGVEADGAEAAGADDCDAIGLEVAVEGAMLFDAAPGSLSDAVGALVEDPAGAPEPLPGVSGLEEGEASPPLPSAAKLD